MIVARDKEELVQDTRPKDTQDSQPHKSCLALGCVFAECHCGENTEAVIYYGLVIKSFK